MDFTDQRGPLEGLRVVEFASIGPGPHCATLLADLGANVLRIERNGGNGWPNAVMDRGRQSIAIDITTPNGRALCCAATEQADILIEGYRPGVMERNGLGPDELLRRNPRLIYGRITGWGQNGPLAVRAGHDINYLALSGALASFGTPGTPPPPPLNLLGDFGGGSMFLAFGILAALYERKSSGMGQVIDAAILDGVASMMGMFGGMSDGGRSMLDRETSMLGGAAHFYRCYECSDGRYVSVGAIEAKFYAEFITRIGAPASFREEQNNAALWLTRSQTLEAIFRTRTRDEWSALLQDSDACFAPVLNFEEAQIHDQMRHRRSYQNEDGYAQQVPAPRFSRTPGVIAPRGDGKDLLHRWGIDVSTFEIGSGSGPDGADDPPLRRTTGPVDTAEETA